MLFDFVVTVEAVDEESAPVALKALADSGCLLAFSELLM